MSLTLESHQLQVGMTVRQVGQEDSPWLTAVVTKVRTVLSGKNAVKVFTLYRPYVKCADFSFGHEESEYGESVITYIGHEEWDVWETHPAEWQLLDAGDFID